MPNGDPATGISAKRRYRNVRISCRRPDRGNGHGEVAAGVYFFTGNLQLVSGLHLRWRGGVSEVSASGFSDEGRPLVRFNRGSFFDRVNTYVVVHPEARDPSEWPLLVSLGLYLRLAMCKVFRR